MFEIAEKKKRKVNKNKGGNKAKKDKIYQNKKSTKKEEEKVLSTGRVSKQNANSYRNSNTISKEILTDLNNATNKYKAMDILVDKTPFGKMALNVYTTLTNPDGEYIFTDPTTGERLEEPELLFKEFSKKRFANNDAGLEGIYDILVRSNYTRGDMAFEVIVSDDATMIEDIVVIDPMSFDEFAWDESKKRLALYQSGVTPKVDLYDGNFYRFPYQPNLNSPFGTLLFEPAIAAEITYRQHELDGGTVLNRVGYPRYLAEIDVGSVLEMARPNEKDTFQKRQELMQATFDEVQNGLTGAGRDSDIITFNTNKIDTIGGTQGAGIDLRSWYEMDVVALADAYSLPKIYLNMEKGGSYALGSAEQQILIDRVDNSRDNVVAIKELIANLFCRVSGINAVAKFKARPLEWQKLTEKWEAKTKELEYYRRQEEYGYMEKDKVANILNGTATAMGVNTEMYEYIRYQKESEVASEEKKA